MTAVKNAYIEKLSNIVDKYNNTYHRRTKLEPSEIKKSTNINLDVENNYKEHKFKVDDYVSISKYKKIFAKG